MTQPSFIDYSQYLKFVRCPWLWYETYVNELAPRRKDRPRDDNMAIGSLVHAGLENWTRNQLPNVSQATVDEINPTPDTLALAAGMVIEYARRYPAEQWEMVFCEEPLKFPLLGRAPLTGLAKVDKYFYVPEQTAVETGIEGEALSLAPGWWIHEYKTKSAAISRANYAMAWESNMQADFQMLALQAKLGEPPAGMIVQVLEKPRTYVPKRKCKGCQETVELASWLPTGDGQHACPLCGNRQTLKPYEPKAEPMPAFYRLGVIRSQERLSRALGEITSVAWQMAHLAAQGLSMYRRPPNREACVHPQYGPCAYFRNHTYDLPTTEDASMEHRDATRYVGLEVA
jgi:hypothetical protein